MTGFAFKEIKVLNLTIMIVINISTRAVSCVTQDLVMFIGNESIADLAESLTTVVTFNRDKSSMVEELSEVSDAPLLITLSP